MFKRLLLITLSIMILLTSVSVVYAEGEADKMPDYEVILSDPKVDRLIDFDFDDKPGYFDNISEAEDRKSIIDSEHKVSYSFPEGGNNVAYKKLSEPVSKGIIFINFDFRIEENIQLFYIRLLNSVWTGNTVENTPNMTETFAVKGANAGFYAHSNYRDSWTVSEKTELTLNEWHNITMWLDLDIGKIYYVFDNEFIEATGSNPSELTDFCGILFSKQGATEAFIDNLNVAAVDRAYLENFSANGVNLPDDLKDTVTVRADIGELGNAVYEKNTEIPAKISVFNKLSVPQDLKVLAKAKTRSGEDVKDYEFELTVEPGSTGTIEFKLAGMDKYGYNDLYLEVYSKDTNELVGKDVYEYALVNTPPEGLRNQKVGVIDHARPANARLGDPIINAEFASRAGFATTRSEHDWEQYEQEKGVYKLSDLYKKLFAYKRSQNMGHLDILTAANSLYGSDNPPSTPTTIEGFKNYSIAIVGDLIKESGGNELEVEIWNEYNNEGTWFNPDNQPASMYYELIKATYPALKEKYPKEEYPDIRVWGMSTLGVDIEWIEEVLKLGGGEYMDGISVHPYTMKEMPDLGWTLAQTLELKEVLKKYGYNDETMPLRATEWGWSSIGVDGYLNEAEQASAFIRMMVLNDHYDLFEQIDWYTINDGGDQPTQEHGFGLVRWMDAGIPYGVKPSYLTACNYNALMTDAVYEKNIKIGDDVESYKYTLRDGRDCVVAWVKQPDGKETVSVDLGTDSATLMDAYGNEKIVYSNNGIFTLQYTQMPQYLIGDFTKLEAVGEDLVIDFEDYNSIDDVPTDETGAFYLATVGTTAVPELAEIDGNKSLKLVKTDDGSGYNYFRVKFNGEATKTQKVVIEYDMMSKEDEPNLKSDMYYNAEVNSTAAIIKHGWKTSQFIEGGNKGFTTDTTNPKVDTWYHVKHELDIANDTAYTVFADKATGTAIWGPYTDTNFTAYEYLRYLDFHHTVPNGHITYFDNIKVDYVYDKPKVTADSVKLYADGAEQTDKTEVSPLTDSITVDFGTEMNADTLTDDNVYVSNKATGAKVETVLSYKDGVLTVSLTEKLMAESDYKLVISDKVTSVKGDKVEIYTPPEFTTETSVSAVLTGTYVGATKVTELEELKGGDTLTINVSCANSTSDVQPYSVIIAYYNGSKLEKLEPIKTENISASVVTRNYTYNHTVADLTDITKIKFLSWEGLNMVPLSRCITLE